MAPVMVWAMFEALTHIADTMFWCNVQVGWLADKVNRVRLLFVVILIGCTPCLLTYWVGNLCVVVWMGIQGSTMICSGTLQKLYMMARAPVLTHTMPAALCTDTSSTACTPAGHCILAVLPAAHPHRCVCGRLFPAGVLPSGGPVSCGAARSHGSIDTDCNRLWHRRGPGTTCFAAPCI